MHLNECVHCHAVKNNKKPFSGESQEIVILQTKNKEGNYPSLKYGYKWMLCRVALGTQIVEPEN